LFPAQKGKNVFNRQDLNGTHLAHEPIAAAPAGGGFNAYKWPKTPNAVSELLSGIRAYRDAHA
jgi:signal transduction histidine kinase